VNWDDLRIFIEVFRQGSNASAARTLKVNATTVARRIAALEHDVGTKLFRRSPEGQELTADGQLILAAVERMEAEALAVQRKLEGEREGLSGTVRLTSSPTLATEFLIPALSGFAREHPGLAIEHSPSVRYLDLARGEADIAVRVAPKSRGVPSAQASDVLVARKLADIRIAAFASAEYVESKGAPAGAHDMKGHRLVGRTEESSRMPGAGWVNEAAQHGTVSVRCDGFQATRKAILAGYGVGLLPSFLACDGVVAVGEPLVGEEQTAWALVHSDLRNTARVRAVLDALVEVFERFGGDAAAG
jgi:DNA-binding transcriptional LysR family regulator